MQHGDYSLTVMVAPDENQQALRQVEKATDSDPVSGEDLLESPDNKRTYAEIKKQLAKVGSLPSKPSGEQPVE
jgi:hypothetical protein